MASEAMIGRMFTLLREVWPRDAERISPLTMEVYARVLADVPDDLLQAGVVALLSEATFWPKPAEIRRACLDLVAPAERTAGEAWALVGHYLNLPLTTWIGGTRYAAKPLPEDVFKAVQAIGGLSYLRTSENAMSDRARFCDAYEAIAKRDRDRARMLPEVREVKERIEAAREPERLEAGGC